MRDQWLDYQQVTAALDQNEQLAQELGNKGYQLSEDKRAAALSSFSGPLQIASIYGNTLGNAFGIKTLSLSNTLNTLDAALSALQKMRGMSATEQGSLNAVEKNALSAVEKNALNAVQQGALSAVYKELAKAVEQGALSAVQQNGSLSAVQQNGSLSAVQQGSLQMLNLVLYGNMSNIQGALNGMMIRNVENGGVNMLGTARQFNEFEDLIDSRARPAINE